MNLLAGLEKFGIKSEGEIDITKEEKKTSKKAAPKKAAPKVLTEEDLLLAKEYTCPVCDAKFKALMVKTGKAKKLGQEFDLRPRHEGIDTIKYDVIACPDCGYAAMTKTFEPLSNTQIKWIREQVGENFKPQPRAVEQSIYTYDEAIDRYKLALVSAMVKRVKLSEKAYICLKISWLQRAMLKEMPETTAEELEAKNAMKEEMLQFYQQAYEGFTQCMSKETPPFYGMDSNTLEFMLANMAIYFKDYDTALKLVSRLITSPNTAGRVKDKCLQLKEQIAVAKKKQDAAAAAQKPQA